jgi:hypothetical protein
MPACRQASRSAAKAWAVRAMTGVWREPFSRRGFQRALAQREQRLRRLPPGNAAVEALFAFRSDGQDGVEIDQALTEGILRIPHLHPLHADTSPFRRLPHYLHGQPGGVPALIRGDIRRKLLVAGSQGDRRPPAREREQANRQRQGGGYGKVTLRSAQTPSGSS